MKQINDKVRVKINSEVFMNKVAEAHKKIVKESPASLIIADILAHFASLIAGELFGYIDKDDVTIWKLRELCEKYDVKVKTSEGAVILSYFEEFDGVPRQYSKKITEDYEKVEDFEQALKDFVLSARQSLHSVWGEKEGDE